MIQALQMVAASKRQSLRRPRSSISQSSNEFITMNTDMKMIITGMAVNGVKTDGPPHVADDSQLDVYQNEHEIETALTNIYKKLILESKYDDDSAYAMKRCRKTCDFLDLKKNAYMCVHNYISTMVFFAIMTGSQKSRGTAGRSPFSTQLYALYGDDNDKEDEDDDEYTNTTSASPHSLLYAPFIFVHSLL